MKQGESVSFDVSNLVILRAGENQNAGHQLFDLVGLGGLESFATRALHHFAGSMRDLDMHEQHIVGAVRITIEALPVKRVLDGDA